VNCEASRQAAECALGCGLPALGRWAAGLLLAKPFHCHISIRAFDQARGQDGWILAKLLFYMCLWTASVCFMFALASEIFFLAEHSA